MKEAHGYASPTRKAQVCYLALSKKNGSLATRDAYLVLILYGFVWRLVLRVLRVELKSKTGYFPVFFGIHSISL